MVDGGKHVCLLGTTKVRQREERSMLRKSERSHVEAVELIQLPCMFARERLIWIFTQHTSSPRTTSISALEFIEQFKVLGFM